MSEMQGIEIPAVPPGGYPDTAAPFVAAEIAEWESVSVTAGPARVRMQVMDMDADNPAPADLTPELAAELAAKMGPGSLAVDGQGPALTPENMAELAREFAGAAAGPVPAGPDPLAAANGRPVLLHSGNYGLYLTPAGDYHLVYQRTASTNPDTGEVCPVDGAPQVHLRDLPQKAAEMVAAVMDRDLPLPPVLEQLIFSGGKPSLKSIGQVAAMIKTMSEAGDDNAAV